MKTLKKILLFIVVALAAVLTFFSFPELIHKNKGESISLGKVNKGKLDNPYLFPFRGKNFRYFSFISYYLMDNAYVNSKVYHTVLDAYEQLGKSHPNEKFWIMECSDKKGGKLKLHRTHQNGLSIDFMSPKKGQGLKYNGLGLRHYLLDFDENGKLLRNKSVEINFELMAQHILALQKAGKKYGVRVKKVILKINLKDDLWKTPSGKKLKASNIYFAQSLEKNVDDMHDDHYHIDFEILK